MARLPENPTYQTTGATQSNKSPASYASLLGGGATSNPLAAFTRPANLGSPNFAAPPPDIPNYQTPEVNTPAMGMPTTRYSPVPEGYVFDPAKQMSGYDWSNPTPGQTTISNLPGGGQYALDRANPSAIIHSPRKRTDEEDFIMLGGRSSKLYQIDHIIPLWAGGFDVASNKQVLTLNQHKQKTDAQAVPLTLLANKKITTTQARSMALSWKEKDLSDLPDSEIGNGMIPLAAAEEIAARWDRQMSTPMSGFESIKKAGGGSFWKGLFGSVPEGTEKVVHAIGGVGRGYIPDPIQDVIGGLLEGGVAGLSAGWASAPSEHPSVIRDVSSLVGNIGGMFLPIGMITKGLGLSVKGLKGMRVLSETAAAKNGITTAKKVISEAEQAADDVARIAKGKTQPTGWRALGTKDAYKYVPAFAIYGQATPRGLAGVLTGQEDTHPYEQFFSDLAFGVGASVFPPSILGRAKMGALALTTGAMFNPDNPRDWLINAGVMFALHGMGSTPARLKFEKDWTDTSSRFAMDNILYPYTGNTTFRARSVAELPVFHTGDRPVDDAMGGYINNQTNLALENLARAASGSDVSGKSAGTPLYRGATKKEVDALMQGGKKPDRLERNLFGEEIPEGYTFTTDKLDLAKHYSTRAAVTGKPHLDGGYVIEYKPSVRSKSQESISKEAGSVVIQKNPNEFYSKNLSLDDVVRITDKNGKVVYEAPVSDTGMVGLSPSEVKNMNYDDWQREANKIKAAGRHLWKQTLDPESRAIEDAKDTMSIASVVKQAAAKPPGSFKLHTNTTVAKDALDINFLKESKAVNDSAMPPELPRGRFPTTGMATNVNPNKQEIVDWFGKLAKGEASRKGILTLREDTAPFWRNENKTYSASDIAEKIKTPFSETETKSSLQHHGISWDADGAKTTHDLGWASRKSRIDERKNNWNDHPAVRKYIETDGAEGFPPMDSANNMEVAAEIMRKNNWDVAVTHIGKDATLETALQKEPWIPFTIDWKATKELNERMANMPTASVSTMSELISKVNSGVKGGQQSMAIAEIKNRIQEPADETLAQVPIQIAGDPVYRDATQTFTKSAKESVEGNSPEEVSQNFAEKMGVVLDEGDAITVFQNKNQMSTRDLFNIIKSAEETGWVSPSTKGTLDYLVKPFFNSADFKAWPLAKAFPDLRLSGGIKGAQRPPMGKVVDTGVEGGIVDTGKKPLFSPETGEQLLGSELAQIEAINAKYPTMKDTRATLGMDTGTPPEAPTSPVEQRNPQEQGMDTPQVTKSTTLNPQESAVASAEARFSEARRRGEVIDEKNKIFKENGTTYSVEGESLKGSPLSLSERLQNDPSVYPLPNYVADSLKVPSNIGMKAPAQPVSPLVTRMVAKAAEIPTEVITSAQKANERMSLATQPASRFTAGKQSFKLPTGLAKVGDQIGFGPIPDQVAGTGARDIYTIGSSEPVNVPPSGAVVPVISANPVKEVSYEMYNRASEIMQELDPVYFMKEGQERGGPAAYIRSLKGIVDKIEPQKGVNLSPQKIKEIRIAISKQLFNDAKKMVRNAFDSYTNEFGETVPMSWEVLDTLFAKIVRDPGAATPQTIKQWGDLQSMLAKDAKEERFMTIPKPSKLLSELDASGKEITVSESDPRNLPKRIKLPPYEEQKPTSISSMRDSAAFRQTFPEEKEYIPNFSRDETVRVDKDGGYKFFEKQLGSDASNGDVLRFTRDKGAQDAFEMINFGKEQQPLSYSNARSWVVDKKLSDIFKTPDYMAEVSMYDFWRSPRNFLGIVTGLERKVQL